MNSRKALAAVGVSVLSLVFSGCHRTADRQAAAAAGPAPQQSATPGVKQMVAPEPSDA
jgi:hypothetical protein